MIKSFQQTYLSTPSDRRKTLWTLWEFCWWTLGIIALAVLMLLAGCASTSPYKPHAEALAKAYQEGKISANELFTGMAQLEALELQRRQNISQGLFNAGYYMQNQQYLNQMNQPRQIWLYRGN